MHTDANATLGIVNRQGLGKLRHVKVQYLWLQERVRTKDMKITEVPGKDNPADLMTKYLPRQDMDKHLESLAIELRNDRASIAPTIATCQQLATRDHTTQQRRGSYKHDDNYDDDYYDDHYITTTTTIRRAHRTARKQLLTPMRVNGSPPANALLRYRLTRCNYLDNGEAFTIVDEWTSPKGAHADLGRWWKGTTTFTLKQR